MKRIKLLSIIALLSVTIPQAWGQTPEVLGQWNFTGQSSFGTSPLTAATTADNLTVGGLTRGPGITTTGTAAANAWGGNGFYDGGAGATLAGAVTGGNYVTFTVTANSGYNVSFTEIGSFNTRRSNQGPQEMQWQYSLNGTTFTNVGSSLAFGGTSSSGTEQPATPLTSEAALQNVPPGTTVVFRAVIYNYVQPNDGGNFYFNGTPSVASPSLIINGIVAPGNPLPLQLLSFKGKTENNANRIDWTTTRESNVSRFELERSTNGQNFTQVAELDAKGNEISGNNQYSYTDNEAGATAYYRLKMIDKDAKFNYSTIVVLRKGINSSNVRLYPNPAGNTLFLEGLQGNASYFITDAMGRNVAATTTVAATGTAVSVNVAHLTPGFYFLRFIDEHGSASVKFIKE